MHNIIVSLCNTDLKYPTMYCLSFGFSAPSSQPRFVEKRYLFLQVQKQIFVFEKNEDVPLTYFRALPFLPLTMSAMSALPSEISGFRI